MPLLATPFISPVPVRLSHAAGPAVRIPCLCMRSPCPLSSPSLDFSPIAFRPASCGARLAPHATFEPDLYPTSCDGTANGPSPYARGLEVARLVCFSFRHRNAPAEPPVCATRAGSGMASGSDLSLCLRPRLLPSVPRTPRPCTSESCWTLDSEPARRPTLSLSVARSPAWSP